ncbi:uncharacterized protein LOC143912013 isoform X2 [Arctopsyche grandis]|uniref:uncharacterized protein LOC143912013 isoform X2 n=1 Tax=Arctopsyche grandis TaxID=121162 RepID=UPI00406D9468
MVASSDEVVFCTMECRLCLYSGPAESSVSIHDDLHPLAQHIWICSRLQIKKNGGLPDTICVVCVNNFRNICLQNYLTSKLKLDMCLDIKTEEVLLEDLTWENEPGANVLSRCRRKKMNLNGYGGEIKDDIRVPSEEPAPAETSDENFVVQQKNHTPFSCSSTACQLVRSLRRQVPLLLSLHFGFVCRTLG